MKVIVKDKDGKTFAVEELKKDEFEEELFEDELEEIVEKEKVEEPAKDAEGLLPEELAALKRLAAVADKLINLVDIETEEHGTLDEDIEEDEVEEDEEKEEILDTKRRDSKASFGAIEKAAKVQAEDVSTEIDQAWSKRYGGK